MRNWRWLLMTMVMLLAAGVVRGQSTTHRTTEPNDKVDVGTTLVPSLFDISSALRLEDPANWVPKSNGCLIEQTGSKIHIVGTNNIDGSGNGNGITSTRFLPAGNFYATVDFMVPRFSGSGNMFIYLRAKSTTDNGKMVAILYQPSAGTYQIQGWGVDGATNTFNQLPLRNIGDEDKVFHRMKLKYDAAAKIVSGWVDDKFIGTLNYTLTDPVKFELLADTDRKGMQIDLFLDNLSFTSDISQSPRTPAIASSVIPGGIGAGTSRAVPAIPEVNDKAGPALRGAIGMGTWDTKAEFRDILVQTSDGKTLLQPNFSNGLDSWQRGGGEWTSVTGVLNQNSRAINCQIICGENSWTDYTYSLRAKRTEGTEGFLIIFAAQDSKNLYWWNIAGWGNTRTAIEKMTRGGKREITGTAVDLRIETGIWYDIKIAIHGDTADCYFNGKLITRINRDRGYSSLPDTGPPTVVNNGDGPQLANPVLRTTTPVIIPDISPTPKLDNPASWVPIANGCQIQQTGNKIQITGTNNIDGWDHGNGVISTSVVPAGDFYATVNFIARRFGGPGNARVYFRVVSTKDDGKMVAITYDPKARTFQLQGWGVNGEPDTFGRPPVQQTGSENMMYQWMSFKYDSANKTISATAASNRYLGTIDYDLSEPVRFELLADTDKKGMQIDIEFNNFSVTIDKSRIPATPDRLTGGIPEQSTTRIWKSPNGKYAVKIVENLVVTGRGDGARGPIIFRRTVTYVTGMAVDPNGTTSKQWEWTEPQPPQGTSSSYSSYITLQVADVLVGDSGNRFVLLGRYNSNPTRAFQRVIVILDAKGKTHTEVTADDWSKALGPDGKIELNNPPKLRFLENEKVLEITFESGTTVHVNVDSGEVTVVKRAATTPVLVSAPATQSTPAATALSTSITNSQLTMENAQMAVRLLALQSPNPYVREMAYHDHDTDWSIDLKAKTFSVKIHGLQDKTFTGKLQPADPGAVIAPKDNMALARNISLIPPEDRLQVVANFDDEGTLSGDWIVPADAVLTVEEASRCLAAMGERMVDPYPQEVSANPAMRYGANFLKTLVAAMKGVPFKADAATGRITGSAAPPRSGLQIDWRVYLCEKTFYIQNVAPGAESGFHGEFSGRFGWDKDRHWTAWPIDMTGGIMGPGGGRLRTWPAIPEQNLALGKPTLASSSLEGHSAGAAVDADSSTFWQPADDDEHPTWTVDLKSAVALSSVRTIYTDSYGYRQPTIEVSDDQKTWRRATLELSPTSGGPGPTMLKASFSGTTIARFVRLSFPSSTSEISSATPRAPSLRGRSSLGQTIQLCVVAIDGSYPPK
jgi:hypothetical protein